MDIIKNVSELITKPVSDLGYDIAEITYQKEDGMYFLRIIIDKAGSITIDDCVAVSKLVNPLLDEADLISDNYILDVCSK